MAKLFKRKSFALTKVDRQAFDPEHGCLHDLNWWMQLYFDGEAYPWQDQAPEP